MQAERSEPPAGLDSSGITTEDIFRRISSSAAGPADTEVSRPPMTSVPSSGFPGPAHAGDSDLRGGAVSGDSRLPVFSGYDTPAGRSGAESDGRYSRASRASRGYYDRGDTDRDADRGGYSGGYGDRGYVRRSRSRSRSSSGSRRTDLERDRDSRKLELFLMVQTLERQLDGFGIKLPRPVHPGMSIQELNDIFVVLKRQRNIIKGGKQLRKYLVSGASVVELASSQIGIGLELEDFADNIEVALDEDDTLVDDLAEEESDLLNIPSSVRLAILVATAGLVTHKKNVAKIRAQEARAASFAGTGTRSAVSAAPAAPAAVPVPVAVPPESPIAAISQLTGDDDGISIGSDISAGTETSSRRGKRRGPKPSLAHSGRIAL